VSEPTIIEPRHWLRGTSRSPAAECGTDPSDLAGFLATTRLERSRWRGGRRTPGV